MVHVEQDALRAFEQYPCPCFAHFVQPPPHGLGIFQNKGSYFFQIGNQAGAIYGRFTKSSTQRIMVCAKPVKLGIQGIKMRKVAHTNRATPHLVFIGRANTAACGSDLARTCCSLTQPVKVTVDRQDQRAVVRQCEILGRYRNALPAQLCHFITQRPWVEDDPVADNRQRAGDNARRQQR